MRKAYDILWRSQDIQQRAICPSVTQMARQHSAKSKRLRWRHAQP